MKTNSQHRPRKSVEKCANSVGISISLGRPALK
jgi:hypothetical protein